MNRKVIKDANAPNPIGSYNQAVIANGFVFTLTHQPEKLLKKASRLE